ncbi:hypothetical protein [Parerythrobacter lacustris]|uniref:Lipoprotein n=1 Tax=Parerythrobacter lacustris TaxID=2969984 RepID=A0ABT1XMR6_9SPHN|nr:hypothetical protein [Parerythrobacter lacustris]MCR2832943.1 hypothetical protein [Parerythrobacter lacustris]
MAFFRNARHFGIVALTVASLALSSCILLPGKFASTLDLRSDGTFTFTYDGQMLFLPMSEEFASEEPGDTPVDEAAIEAGWEPSCFDEETYEQRDCTEEEKAERIRQDEELRAEIARSEKERNEQMIRLLAGIDPKDPEAGNKFAAQLERQAGWESVVYRGNGVFDVKYRITSRIDHDFAFPSIEGMNFIPPFVQINRRDSGAVRINAPGYSAQAITNGLSPAFLLFGQSMGASDPMAGKGDDDMMQFIDGSFVVTTDGEILANNTDEGPVARGSDKSLEWKINSHASQAPTALIRIR